MQRQASNLETSQIDTLLAIYRLWRDNITAEQRPLANAARAQHAFLLHAGTAAADQHVSSADLANRLGITIDQYRRLRRGEAHLTLADMHQLAAHLGIPIDTRARPTTGSETVRGGLT